jgi:hypothetical protein
MAGRLEEGAFVLRHPQRDGRCVSIREWAADDEELDDSEGDDAVEAPI